MIVLYRPRQPFSRIGVRSPMRHVTDVGERLEVGEQRQVRLALAPVIHGAICLEIVEAGAGIFLAHGFVDGEQHMPGQAAGKAFAFQQLALEFAGGFESHRVGLRAFVEVGEYLFGGRLCKHPEKLVGRLIGF